MVYHQNFGAYHVKVIEECVMCTDLHVLVKICLQMGYTWVCHFEPESKRQSIEGKHTDSSAKTKFQA